MNSAAREDYLTNEIMTATPQKLQLMLIEAALRQSQKTRALWQERKEAEAGEAIVRAQEIVTQLLAGVKPDADVRLARQIVGVYGFVFRTLVAAHLQHSDKKLAEAISILEIERETWRQVCQKLATSSASKGSPTGAAADMPLESGTSFVA
jgi:flagellar protein FliS